MAVIDPGKFSNPAGKNSDNFLLWLLSKSLTMPSARLLFYAGRTALTKVTHGP